jgi:uncharacterized membrane protein
MGPDKKTTSWLYEETKRWTQNGLISNSQAEAIKGLYPLTKTERPWGLLVFSGIGAVIIGLGIILLFAYNWEKMTKFSKLAVIFMALISSHGIGVRMFLSSERFKGLGEAISVLGTMLFGAGIWLVASIYHIEEHYPNAFFIWAFGALLLTLAMPSVLQGILAAVLFAIWSGAEAIEFHQPMLWAIPLLLSIFVLAHQKASKVLLAVVMLSLWVTIGFVSGSYLKDELILLILLSVSACYMAAGHISGWYGRFRESKGVYNSLGFVGFIIFLYILSFDEMVKEVYRTAPKMSPAQLLYFLLPAALAVVGWVWVLWKMFSAGEFRKRYELLLIPLVLIFGFLHLLAGPGTFSVAVAVFNVVFLAQSVLMMGRGCRDGQMAPTVVGSLMLIALTIGRYVDLFESLFARGVIFIVVGAILFAEGIFYIRSRKKLRAKTETE